MEAKKVQAPPVPQPAHYVFDCNEEEAAVIRAALFYLRNGNLPTEMARFSAYSKVARGMWRTLVESPGNPPLSYAIDDRVVEYAKTLPDAN